jgi:hypothetical protein
MTRMRLRRDEVTASAPPCLTRRPPDDRPDSRGLGSDQRQRRRAAIRADRLDGDTRWNPLSSTPESAPCSATSMGYRRWCSLGGVLCWSLGVAVGHRAKCDG